MKWMNNYDTPKKASMKRHEKYVVVTNSYVVHMKDMTIWGKDDSESEGVSSIVNPKDVQRKTYETFILCNIIVTLYNSHFVTNTIDAFNDWDNSPLKIVIHVIMNVEVSNFETSPDNPMYNIPIHFEPKEVDYNINICNDVN